MKNLKNITALILACLMLLSLCACGSAASGKTQSSSQSSSAYYDEAPAAMEMAYNAPSFGNFAIDEAEADYAAGLGASAPVPAPAAKAEGGAEQPAEKPTEKPDKIIYQSDVTVETTVFDETIGKISGLVDSYGGWIESSSVSGSNYYQKARGTASTRNASYTLRIPSDRFTEIMDSFSELGNIPFSHIYTENVSAQYYDAQARLKAYTTQETRLLEMMELAESVEDVIIIEDRLTELRYQIESIQSNLNNWDRRVSYSTIYLTVQEVKEYTPEEKVNPTYGEELKKALKDGFKNAGEFLKNLLVFLVEILPVLVILVPLAWLVIWLIRKLFRGSGERRAARAEKKRQKQTEKRAKKAAKNAAPAPAEPAGKAAEPAPAAPAAASEKAAPAEAEKETEK